MFSEYSLKMYKIRKDSKAEFQKQKKESLVAGLEGALRPGDLQNGDVPQVAVIRVDEDEEEIRRLERKKRTQEDMVEDFVKLLEKMMNPRQALTSVVSAAIGLVSVVVGIFYRAVLPDTALKAIELDKILIAYGAAGVFELLLAGAFFVTCMQTSLAVSRGLRDALHIVVGVLVALVYILLTAFALVIGIIGFYKVISVVSAVEYNDAESNEFFPRPLFVTCLTVFVTHIVMIVLKCCCCK